MAMIDSYRNNVIRKKEELAKLSSDKARENDKIAKARQKIDTANSAIRRTSSISTIKSRQNDIIRAEKEITNSEKKIADIQRKSSRLSKDISDLQKKIDKEEANIHKKRIQDERKEQQKTQTQISKLNQTMMLYENRQNILEGAVEDLMKVPETITVLFLASNPQNTTSLRLDAECRDIQEMIRKSEYRDNIRFETRWALRTSDLLQAINEVNPDIIHFSGHGTNEGELVFENSNGDYKLVSKEAIAQTVMTLSDKIRLIFFNACFSAIQAESIVEFVDASIGMNVSIGDEAARIFASQFYSSIGFGKNLKDSFNQAKAALMLEGIPEETTPQLYVNSKLKAEDIILVQP